MVVGYQEKALNRLGLKRSLRALASGVVARGSLLVLCALLMLFQSACATGFIDDGPRLRGTRDPGNPVTPAPNGDDDDDDDDDNGGQVSYPSSDTRGYEARPCGFDLNHDGVIGGPGDCNICDGGNNRVDVDGDGQMEDEIYVDCSLDKSVNNTCDGTPGKPCATINHAWRQIADGPSNGEDIICFTGVCRNEPQEGIRINKSGKAGVYTRPRSGSEARDFELPRHPTMLVGWDKDNDGRYPPYDQNDTSIIDGQNWDYSPGSEAVQTFHVFRPKFGDNANTSFVEFAHFEIRNILSSDHYPKIPDAQRTTVKSYVWDLSGGNVDHWYSHDIEIKDNKKGQCLHPEFRMINFQDTDLSARWMTWENMECRDCSGYGVRGSRGALWASEWDEYFRWKNWSYLTQGPLSACINSKGNAVSYTTSSTFFKGWGRVRHLEFIDSYLDGQSSQLSGSKSHWGPKFVINEGTHDWHIVNNESVDVTQPYAAAPWCDESPVGPIDGVHFEGNVIRLTQHGETLFGDRMVGFNKEPNGKSNEGECSNQAKQPQGYGSAAHAEIYATNFTIINNLFYSPGAIKNAIAFSDYNNSVPTNYPSGAQNVIAHNTIMVGDSCTSSFGCLGLGDINQDPSRARQIAAGDRPAPIRVENNLIAQDRNGRCASRTEHFDSRDDWDANVYAPSCFFADDSENMGFSGWKSLMNASNSKVCEPIWEATGSSEIPSVPDPHLDASDTCSQNQAIIDPSTHPFYDIDGEQRPSGGMPDIGADEVS